MNILVERLPSTVTINGEEYSIDTDFRAGLRVLLAYEDAILTPQERMFVLLNNLYGDKLPEDIEAAINKGIWFLDCGGSSDGDNQVDPRRYYSFSKDAKFIFAAFRQTHGIDLEIADLHWWKFVALFMDIGSDTTFSNLVSLRKRVKTGSATKEDRKLARELGDMFEVADLDTRTAEERAIEQQFWTLYYKGEQS